MKLSEATAATKHFGMGVYAEIWCAADKGSWGVVIESGDSRVAFYNLDDLKRTVAKLKLALDHVQSVSEEDCWKEPPADPFAEITR
jgi:hypothetical protein